MIALNSMERVLVAHYLSCVALGMALGGLAAMLVGVRLWRRRERELVAAFEGEREDVRKPASPCPAIHASEEVMELRHKLRKVMARRGAFHLTIGQLAYDMAEPAQSQQDRAVFVIRLREFLGWTFFLANGSRFHFTEEHGDGGVWYRARLINEVPEAAMESEAGR